MDIKFNPKIINATVRVNPQANESYTLDAYVDTFVTFNSLFVKIAISLPSPSGKFDKTIQSTVQDVCKYFGNKNGNILLRLFFNSNMSTRHQFPKSCPIPPGHFYFEGFKIDERLLTVRGAETKVLVSVEFCFKPNDRDMDCFSHTRVFGEIRDRKKWEKEFQQRQVTKL